MFLSNFTFNIEKEISAEWLKFVKLRTIPSIESTNLVKNVKTFSLLTEIENSGDTFTLQMQYSSMDDFATFELNHKDDILAELYALFLGKIVMFETLLEEV